MSDPTSIYWLGVVGAMFYFCGEMQVKDLYAEGAYSWVAFSIFCGFMTAIWWPAILVYMLLEFLFKEKVKPAAPIPPTAKEPCNEQ